MTEYQVGSEFEYLYCHLRFKTVVCRVSWSVPNESSNQCYKFVNLSMDRISMFCSFAGVVLNDLIKIKVRTCLYLLDFLLEKTIFSLYICLVVQFVNESRFANCEFANLFFDFDELRFG